MCLDLPRKSDLPSLSSGVRNLQPNFIKKKETAIATI